MHLLESTSNTTIIFINCVPNHPASFYNAEKSQRLTIFNLNPFFNPNDFCKTIVNLFKPASQ